VNAAAIEAKTPYRLSDAAGMDKPDPKTIATLQARAALAGYELVCLADGTWIASRWGMFRTLDHAAAVEAFLQRVEAHRS
jgi:hypothetical protein